MDTYVEVSIPIVPVVVAVVFIGLGATYLLRRTRFALPILVAVVVVIGYAILWTFTSG